MKKLFSVCLLLISLSALLISIYLLRSRTRIAYVRSLELVYSYNGMREAHAEFQAQTDEWKTNIDTLNHQYQVALKTYQDNVKSYSKAQKEEQEKEIVRLEENLKKYSTAVQKQAQEKDKKLTQSILNQINSFVEEYAKKKGYDMVLGSESNGAVLYGTDAYDITKDIIEAMNKEYKMLPTDSKQGK